jgi:hypothetical protein
MKELFQFGLEFGCVRRDAEDHLSDDSRATFSHPQFFHLPSFRLLSTLLCKVLEVVMFLVYLCLSHLEFERRTGQAIS